MKRITVLALTFLFSLQVYSQVTEPFIQPGSVWIYYIYGDTGNFMGTEVIEIDTDTLINGKNYYIVGQSFMRTEGNQTYFYQEVDSTEYIMYDFDLVVGDTFVAHRFEFMSEETDSMSAVVLQIDTIQTLDGLFRKQFYYEGGSDIEGIGSTWDIDRPIYQGSVSGFRQLVCFSTADTPVFGESLMGSCLTPIEEAIVGSLKLFPNPTTNTLYIDHDYFENHVILYDINGRVVLEQHNIRNEIDVSKLPNGMYYLSLETDDKFYIERFVKNNN